jgi:hypothetical protein
LPGGTYGKDEIPMTRPATLLALAVPLLAVPVRLLAQDQRATLLEADRAASQFSSDSGLTPALARTLDSRGVFLWPGAPVAIGPAESGRVLLQVGDTIRLSWQPLEIGLARDSSFGFTAGVAVVTSRQSPTPPQVGRYIAAWARHDGPHWTLMAIMFAAVKPPAVAVPPDLPSVRPPARVSGPAARFIEADLAFARLARDSGAAKAFQHWSSPEASIFGREGLLARGPQAIGRDVDGPALWRWHPVVSGAAGSGDLGWTAGEAVITPQNGPASYSKYLTIWVRPDGGPARFITDGGNSRPPPDAGGEGARPKQRSPG